MSDDPVGRGNPPKHSQFKPGVSGNPRGRRRKLPRADIPSQIGKDVLRIAETKVFTTQNGRRVKISLIEGVLMSIFKQAAEGKISQQRLVLKYFDAALSEKLERLPHLANIDVLEAMLIENDLPLDDEFQQLIDNLIRRSKRKL
jgi:hypothetical protein